MGLDGVEILIEVEDRFGITIRDAEAQRICTVGDLLALINDRIAARAQLSCPGLGAFLEVRRLVRNFLSQPSLRLRPSTPIVFIVPAHRRSALWRIFSDRLGTSAPALRRPRPLRILLVVAACLVFGLGISTALIDPAIVPLGIICALAVIITLQLITSPLRIEPPKTMDTLGDLSRRIIGLSMATGSVTSAQEVLQCVQQIVASILGVNPEDVVPEARFIEDLKMS